MFSHSNDRGWLFLFPGCGVGRAAMNVTAIFASPNALWLENQNAMRGGKPLNSSKHKAAFETAGKGYNSSSINPFFAIV